MEPVLSVVIGCSNAAATIQQCLGSMVHADPAVEIIVVDSSSDGSGDIVSTLFPAVGLVRMAEGLLVPLLWAEGIRRSRGAFVALTTAHCIPQTDWVERCLNVRQQLSSHGGAGGPILEPSGGTAADWAMYLARYSAYLPPLPARLTDDIAGDNALYRRDLLERYWVDKSAFWEQTYHRALHEHGLALLMDPNLAVRSGSGNSFSRFCSVRFRHGTHYGSSRPISAAERLFRFFASPLLAPFLLVRIVRRVLTRRPDWKVSLLRVMPLLAIAVLAWSAGEAAGYLHLRAKPSPSA